mgnify:CR=1 FL=1
MKIITERTMQFGNIRYFCASVANSPMTCYVLRGRDGDMLIDTGMPFIYKRLSEYIADLDIRYIFLTHAHVDHDGSAERLRRETGAEIILGERDRELIGHYGRQPVKAALRRYRLRNIQQNVCGREWRCRANGLGRRLSDERFVGERPIAQLFESTQRRYLAESDRDCLPSC